MKSFREQIAFIMNNYAGGGKFASEIDECATPAAQTLMGHIRRWPLPTGPQAVAAFLTRKNWDKNGNLVDDTDHKGKPYPFRVPLAIAYESYKYGYQKKPYFPSWDFPSAVKSIPENVSPDWAEEIKDLFSSINRMSVHDFKIIALGKQVHGYGSTNPHTFSSWERMTDEFIAAQKAINEFVLTRKGWIHLTTDNLQNPKHKIEMSKVLGDILAKADENVEPARKAIAEQDRRLEIRQDATRARNDVKRILEFFQSYEIDNKDLIDSLKSAITSAEQKVLKG